MDISIVLRQKMLEAGFNMGDVAEILGITKSNVSLRFNGKANWKFSDVELLLARMGYIFKIERI